MIIGVTGGIGVGKSYMVNTLSVHMTQFYIIDLDCIGHSLLEKETVKREIVNVFGSTVLNQKNQIHRPALGAYVFEKKEHLVTLNHIMHPRIKEETYKLIKEAASPHVMIVGALMKEISLIEVCDAMVLITADKKKRAIRIKGRENIAYMQLTEDLYRQFSTHVIHNIYTKDSVEKFLSLIQTLIRNHT